MPLQNRVPPTGDIIATPHRGLFTGNRGIIHDPATKTLLKKRWSSPAWITCVCEFRGWRRKVWGWTRAGSGGVGLWVGGGGGGRGGGGGGPRRPAWVYPGGGGPARPGPSH